MTQEKPMPEKQEKDELTPEQKKELEIIKTSIERTRDDELKRKKALNPDKKPN